MHFVCLTRLRPTRTHSGGPRHGRPCHAAAFRSSERACHRSRGARVSGRYPYGRRRLRLRASRHSESDGGRVARGPGEAERRRRHADFVTSCCAGEMV
jgi:hypothetical protein